MSYTYDDFDDWGIGNEWLNEATYTGDDWWGGSDTNTTGGWESPTDSGNGDWFSGLGGIFSGALGVTGDYYKAQNQLELQRLEAERNRVGNSQQVPVYANGNINTKTLLIASGVAVVAIGAVLLSKG